MSRVLFVYPNKEGYPIIPLGISVLAGLLKANGHETELFDVTFMVRERLDHQAREKTGVVARVDVDTYWEAEEKDGRDMNEAFAAVISSFKPDVIAFSVVENNYSCARDLLRIARMNSNALTLAGGIFPTVAADFFINDDNVDAVCAGEGEYPLLEMCRRLDSGEDLAGIPNLVVKKAGLAYPENFYPYYLWEPFVLQDWGIFDKRHLMKPFMGRMWKTGFFEISRGCPFNCNYCNNRIKQRIFRGLGKYNRAKSVESAMREIGHFKDNYGIELVFFNDENFLSMDDARFEAFCSGYAREIGLPFFIQTRADSLLDEHRLARLKNIGCVTIGIGVESGNEQIRKKLLNKNISNEVFEKAFANCNKFDIRTTAYLMIGLPFETEENILETAEFCRRIRTRSIAISIFAPYYGTKLRDICIENGYIEDRYYDDISVNYSSVLKMPQLSNERLQELYYGFNDMVYGK